MSAYSSIQTHLVSAVHLQKALQDMGFAQVELHTTPQPVEGAFSESADRGAEVIVRRKYLSGAYGDLGFARDEQGRFMLLVNDMDRDTYGAGWLQKLTQRYAYRVAREQLEEQGFDLVSEEVDNRETIRLTLRRMA